MWFQYLKARRDVEKVSDDTLRELRAESRRLWEEGRKMRAMITRLELWIVKHMNTEHGEKFDVESLYEED